MPAASPRTVLALAVPAFFALVAEPLFLLADSAIVGHLGINQLAGLGVASSALLTAANIYVFLAYATTALVSRQLGAGRPDRAISAGLDGVWLSIAIGLVTAIAVALLAEPICRLFGADGAVVHQGAIYLRISAFGIPGMLVTLAATGILRGFQDTRTPLAVSIGGFSLNLLLNLFLVYGIRMGIAGSALGTVTAQTLMAAVLLVIIVIRARRVHASLRPRPLGVLHAARHGSPLLVRTLALRAALLLTTWIAVDLGTTALGAHQVAMTIFSFFSFVLDALAIAAQALTGHALGAGDTAGARAATRLMTAWGLVFGVLTGVLLLLLHTVLPPLFSSDPAVQTALAAALIVLAVMQPVCGVVFVLDGVLMGAGDGRALAWLQVAALAGYLPAVIWLRTSANTLRAHPGHALVLLWTGFGIFMLWRLLGLGWRARTGRWMVTGA